MVGLKNCLPCLRRAALCAALLALPLAGAHAGLEVKWKDIKNPFFGNALYHLYQNKNFSGVIHLSADMELQKVNNQLGDAEVAQAMLYLSYGLHNTATARLLELMSKERIHSDVRNHIWFYLAKIRYQRGHFNRAEAALANITGALPWELEQQLQAFMALLLMDRQQYPMAARVLSQVKGHTGGVPFARFNTAVSYVEAESAADGYAMLEKIGAGEASDSEAKALRDRANTSLGFVYMYKEQPEKARSYFEKVRLNSPSANEALLGLGWSYYVQERYDRALVAWIELADRSPTDTTVQEALVAVPYTFAKIESYGQALKHYEKALNTFKQEHERLQATMVSVKKGEYFDKLLQQRYDGEKGWLGDVHDLPNTPESFYFTQMLARHDYQEALKNYRDLRFLEEKLQSWIRDLDAYENTATQWLRGIELRSSQIGDAADTVSIKSLREERDDYAIDIKLAEEGRDARAVASARELELLETLEALEAAAAAESDAQLAARYRKRIELMRGRVLWSVHSQFGERLHKIKDNLKEIDALLVKAGEQQERVKGASKGTNTQIRSYNQRVDQMRTRIGLLQPQIAEATDQMEQYLNLFALQDLERRKHILERFLAQVSFSVGQTHDQAAHPDTKAPTPEAKGSDDKKGTKKK